MNKVNCIMLIDDNTSDNFFHERVIRKNHLAETVIVRESGVEALDYLKTMDLKQAPHPELIFLDINMPGMNGWEFLEEYKVLEKGRQSKVIIVMLTTSDDPQDKLQAYNDHFLFDFRTKPLTAEMLVSIIEAYA